MGRGVQCSLSPPLPPIPQAVERVLFPHLPSYGASLHAVLDDNSVSNAQVKADGHKVYGAILVSDPPPPDALGPPRLVGFLRSLGPLLLGPLLHPPAFLSPIHWEPPFWGTPF